MEYAKLMKGARELLVTSQIDLDDLFQVEFAKRLAFIIHTEVDWFMDENWDDTPEWEAIPLDMVVPPRTLENIWAGMDVMIKEEAICCAFHNLLINSWNQEDVSKFIEIAWLTQQSDFWNLNNMFKQIVNEGDSNSPLTELSKNAIGINDVNDFTRVLESILISKWITVSLDLPPVLTKFINWFRDLIWITLSDTSTWWNHNPQTTH
jgi:hypothetical protein